MSVRLFVLGLVFEKDTHGYEIKEIAKLWGVDRWANIQLGSIYHALGQLEKEGLVKAKGDAGTGKRPKFLYGVTNAGRSAFFDLLRQTSKSVNLHGRDIDMALAFIDHLPPSERESLLIERLETLRKLLDRNEGLVSQFRAARSSEDPSLAEFRWLNERMPWVKSSVQHSATLMRVEYQWLEGVISEVATWPNPPRGERAPKGGSH